MKKAREDPGFQDSGTRSWIERRPAIPPRDSAPRDNE